MQLFGKKLPTPDPDLSHRRMRPGTRDGRSDVYSTEYQGKSTTYIVTCPCPRLGGGLTNGRIKLSHIPYICVQLLYAQFTVLTQFTRHTDKTNWAVNYGFIPATNSNISGRRTCMGGGRQHAIELG